MRKILVIIDMQNDFITGALGSEEAQKILPSVLQYAQNFSGEILFTKDTHQPNYLESREGKKDPSAAGLRMTENGRKSFGFRMTQWSDVGAIERAVLRA